MDASPLFFLFEPLRSGRQEMRAAFQDLAQQLRDSEIACKLAQAKIVDQSQQLDLLRHLAAKNDVRAMTRLADETVQLRAQLTQSEAELAEAKKRILSLQSSLNQAAAENALGAERVRRNVAGALEIVKAKLRIEQNESDGALQQATSEAKMWREKCAANEAEMARLKSQHEEQLTKLSQRRNTGNEAALRQRIAELEESLSSRDEAAFGRGSGGGGGAGGNGKKGSITKKFKIDH